MSARDEAPTQPRILGPDVARGVMLLLIAMAYAGVYAGSMFGADLSAEPVRDQAAGFVSRLFLDNRAFPMFAILFGYGVAWSVRRRQARDVPEKDIRSILRRRAWLLLLFGAVHAALIYPGEILTSYGLALLVTGWLLFRSDRALWIAAGVTGAFYLIVVPVMMVLSAFVPAEEAGALSGYLTVTDWIERIVFVPFNPLFLAIAYPLLLLVVLGYIAGRKKLFEEPEKHRRTLRAVALVGVTVSVVGALPTALITVGAIDVDPVTDGLLRGVQVLTGVAGGAGYAAFFALATDALDRLQWVPTKAVAAVGKRSLTFYILNSAVVAILLHPDLVGWGENIGAFGALVVAASTWLLGLVLAVQLERRDLPGPLETLMRRGVYGRAG